MSEKTYTVEFTAEELICMDNSAGLPSGTGRRKLRQMAEYARRDHAAARLKLPWTIIPSDDGSRWFVGPRDFTLHEHERNREAACLKSAAPELLDAVVTALEWFDSAPSLKCNGLRAKIAKALRKVQNGFPEE